MRKKPVTKGPATSFRLTPEALEKLKELSTWLGVARPDVLELAIRRMHEDEVGRRK